ncbi:hypothetical protein VPNG_02490 [Cytospora leucostoma]|uniref:Uncharacterized protein n=1 Tax=Cytospora leucostoma TaxID=1230097 RepID=A0A423XI12_9PEZI|nr:hypothetical protein VPNG_02490 [Cytospora leucostoma]
MVASRSDIIDTGIFGLFGEKKAILVDLYDTATFKTLHRISKKPHAMLLESFAKVGERSEQTDIEYEFVLGRKYLLSVLKAERHNKWDDCGWHWQEPGWYNCFYSTCFDYSHPHVKRILEGIPTIEIVVLVILVDE